MPATRGHRKRVARAVGALLAIAHDRHFAFEDEQARIEFVSVLGFDRARLHPAIDDLPIALRLQFVLEFRPVHLHPPRTRLSTLHRSMRRRRRGDKLLTRLEREMTGGWC